MEDIGHVSLDDLARDATVHKVAWSRDVTNPTRVTSPDDLTPRLTSPQGHSPVDVFGGRQSDDAVRHHRLGDDVHRVPAKQHRGRGLSDGTIGKGRRGERRGDVSLQQNTGSGRGLSGSTTGKGRRGEGRGWGVSWQQSTAVVYQGVSVMARRGEGRVERRE